MRIAPFVIAAPPADKSAAPDSSLTVKLSVTYPRENPVNQVSKALTVAICHPPAVFFPSAGRPGASLTPELFLGLGP